MTQLQQDINNQYRNHEKGRSLEKETLYSDFKLNKDSKIHCLGSICGRQKVKLLTVEQQKGGFGGSTATRKTTLIHYFFIVL